MKSIFLLFLIVVAVENYTKWDNWHNIPNAWKSQIASVTWGLLGWKRNGVDGRHPLSLYNNLSIISNQYLYWKASNPAIIIKCSPKYYLYTEELCRINPYFQTTQPNYCIPNYENYLKKSNVCSTSNPLYKYGVLTCCFDNGLTEKPNFMKDVTAIDPYTAPLF